jgi:hypothetical protein
LNALFAGNPDRSGLGTLFSLFFDKGHNRPYLQAAESSVQYAGLLEIDLSALGRQQETVAFFRQQFADAGHGNGLMYFDVPALAPGRVL